MAESLDWRTYVNDVYELFTDRKVCCVCKEEKPKTDFNVCGKNQHTRRPWLSAHCKECGKERSKDYNRSNQHRQRAKRYARRYGITITEYEKLLLDQNERCAICCSVEPGSHFNYFSIDHDHATGEVRGLLCDHCNRGLGYFRDDPEILRAAIGYVRGEVNG